MGIFGRHVDDIIWGGNEKFAKIMDAFRKKFRVGKEQKEEFTFLGIQISSRRNLKGGLEEIVISQRNYEKNINMPQYDDKKPSNKPLDPGEHLEFRRIGGELLWLSQNCRPDIAYRVNELSIHLGTPSIEHMGWRKDVCHLSSSTHWISSSLEGMGYQHW